MAFIYNLDGISNQLIFDLFQEMANNFSVSQFDFLLRCIRLTGIKLHKSNPETFKSITSLIHTVATSAYSNSKTPSLKFKFGLEALLELTQNKFRRQSFFQINESPYLTLCIQELKKRGLMKWEPLEPTLSLILNTEAWWTSIPPCTFSSSTHSISTGNDSSMLLQLAKKHHMNSDLRRTIFGILMTSEDYMDAYERFLKLGLKEKQERDIVRVIVQCAGKEKKFNPYYAHLSLKLCEWKHAYKITYQYTLWDFLKTEPSKKQMSAVAHLYGYFVAHQCLSLMAVLKGIDRYQLAHIEFLQDFVQRIELELGPKKALSIEGILEVKELLRQNVG
ncbi:Nucleolar MIF4G domain-containing protein 1 [Coelomomyces lativittatus]|nr:Nucleolar MIF4G domain-containing protein 1 [Coelomomyces lativittatus]